VTAAAVATALQPEGAAPVQAAPAPQAEAPAAVTEARAEPQAEPRKPRPPVAPEEDQTLADAEDGSDEAGDDNQTEGVDETGTPRRRRGRRGGRRRRRGSGEAANVTGELGESELGGEEEPVVVPSSSQPEFDFDDAEPAPARPTPPRARADAASTAAVAAASATAVVVEASAGRQASLAPASGTEAAQPAAPAVIASPVPVAERVIPPNPTAAAASAEVAPATETEVEVEPRSANHRPAGPEAVVAEPAQAQVQTVASEAARPIADAPSVGPGPSRPAAAPATPASNPAAGPPFFSAGPDLPGSVSGHLFEPVSAPRPTQGGTEAHNDDQRAPDKPGSERSA
jgi:ribonuclease E